MCTRPSMWQRGSQPYNVQYALTIEVGLPPFHLHALTIEKGVHGNTHCFPLVQQKYPPKSSKEFHMFQAHNVDTTGGTPCPIISSTKCSWEVIISYIDLVCRILVDCHSNSPDLTKVLCVVMMAGNNYIPRPSGKMDSR